MNLQSIKDITNYLQIKPWLGTAGMPRADQLKLVADQGFEVVINLALAESPGAILDEAERLALMGLEYIHIPVVWESPELSNFESFISIMDQKKGQKIFVHCVLNMRVSVFVYLYRLLILKEDPDSAYQDLRKIWEPDLVWNDFIRRALARFNST